MYEAFYCLRLKPFTLLPDPEFLFLGQRHKMALSLLEYGLMNRVAFIVITGEPGTGKTTLLNRILDEAKQHLTIGVISNIHVGIGSLMPWIMASFGLETRGKGEVELFHEFADFLLREQAAQRRVLLVLDEAQNLGALMLEELRLLSNLNDGKRKSLQIILSGQPGLRRLLRGTEMVQFAQRIAVDYGLEPLGEDETRAYIAHRIRVAGGTRPLLSTQACTTAFRLTGGNPRLINQLCDTALSYGFADQAPWVTAKLMAQAAMDRSRSGILPLAQQPSVLLTTAEDDEQERRQMAASMPPTPALSLAATASEKAAPNAAAMYARAVALKQAGQLKQAVEHFEQAARDPAYVCKASIQVGLCLRASGQLAAAAAAFRRAIHAAKDPSQDTVSIRYLLGRTLEALGRQEEALDLYRAIRLESPSFRDVAIRIGRLNGRPISFYPSSSPRKGSWVKTLLRSWNQLVGTSS